jgi:hypothetical protein
VLCENNSTSHFSISGKWTKTVLYVLNKKVVVVDPDTQKPREHLIPRTSLHALNGIPIPIDGTVGALLDSILLFLSELVDFTLLGDDERVATGCARRWDHWRHPSTDRWGCYARVDAGRRADDAL